MLRDPSRIACSCPVDRVAAVSSCFRCQQLQGSGRGTDAAISPPPSGPHRQLFGAARWPPASLASFKPPPLLIHHSCFLRSASTQPTTHANTAWVQTPPPPHRRCPRTSTPPPPHKPAAAPFTQLSTRRHRARPLSTPSSSSPPLCSSTVTATHPKRRHRSGQRRPPAPLAWDRRQLATTQRRHHQPASQ